MAVSTRPTLSPTLHIALSYIRSGDAPRARQLLWQTVSISPKNAQAWLLLAHVARTTEEKRAALRHALAAKPRDPRAKQMLRRLLTVSYVRQAARLGIFISYAHRDELFAIELAEDLHSIGFHTWIDVLDINNDADWNQSINQALSFSGLMLLVVSPAGLRAANTRAELQCFLDAGKIVIPIQHEPCDVHELNVWHPPIDFSQRYRAGLENLLYLLQAPKADPAYTR